MVRAMQFSYIIVDNFLDNAEEVRAAALGFDYPPIEGRNFPGRNSKQRLNIQGFSEQVSWLVRERLKPSPGTSHGVCRLTLAGDEGRAGVHIDTCHWSGIYFLSDPGAAGASGTDFFLHKRTGKDHCPLSQKELAELGMASYGDHDEQILKPDTLDPSKWERTMRVPMRFNRLLLFRPWFYHTAGPGFGDSRENGRLVHLLFYDAA